MGSVLIRTQQRHESAVSVHAQALRAATVQRWTFTASPAFCLLLAPFFISTPFPEGLPNNSSPLCHFRLPSLKLALGESFLVLTVEQIPFNRTIESFLPCCWLPSPLLLRPLLPLQQGFLLGGIPCACLVTACCLHRHDVVVVPRWSHEVDLGNLKGKNLPGDPSLHVFG